MANFVTYARTNYVTIKDPETFKKEMEFWNIEVVPDCDNTPNFVCLLPTTGSENGFDIVRFDEKTGDNKTFSFEEHVVPHMEQGQVLVVQSIGYEKLRYLTGQAVAFTHDKPPVRIDISDIYEKAADKLGVNVDNITHAEY